MSTEENEKVSQPFDHPIQAFDKCLFEIRKPNLLEGEIKNHRKMLLRCILAIGGYPDLAHQCEKKDVEQEAMNMLDKFHLMQNKEVVAICYMRVIRDSHSEWARNAPWRPKIIQAIDSLFANNNYKEWNINIDDLAHQKMSQLIDAVIKQEKALTDALDALTSIETLGYQRKKMMSCLNNKTGRLLFRPFLPGNVESLLADVFNYVQDYVGKKDTIEAVDAHMNAIEKVHQVASALEAFRTSYSVMIGENLDKKLLALLESDFTENKANQPASIIVEPCLKKYPLHNAGGKINIGMFVRNAGAGYSYDTELTIVEDNALKLQSSDILVGRLRPGESQVVNILSDVVTSTARAELLTQVNWRDFDRRERSCDFQISIDAQRNDVNWAALAQTDPYSLEAVETESELVGRKEVLNKILGSIKAHSVGSNIISGQKRVGKTSIAKVIKSQLDLDREDFLTVYLESGDYIKSSATGTINRLGDILCKKISEGEPRALKIAIPTFDDAFSPFTDFLDELAKFTSQRKVVIILDEFDQLPYDLYIRGPWGDPFFLTLRSITSRPNVGFILIGGERMAHIMDNQGVQLNRWAEISVDYFSRDTDWADYKELIQRPVNGILEFTDDALLALHESTAGNPYFTKLVCQYVFRSSLNSRDCYVTRTEVDAAVYSAIKETGKNAFQHFWDDRIFETGDKATEKSVRRRKILIALSDTLQKQIPASGKEIAAHPLVKDMPSLESDLKEFATRKVVTGKISGKFEEHSYTFKVDLFQQWLKQRGIQDVIASFSDLDAALLERQRDEQLKLHPDELVELTEKWGTYKGQPITTDKVRAWINQFPSPREQRTMFRVLECLHFYTNAHLRLKMKEINGIVTRGLGRHIVTGKQKRSDILISYLDGLTKSGASMANLFAEESEVYVDNIIEKNKIEEELKKRNDIKAIVFLDDFVGTGVQASDDLKVMCERIHDVVKAKNMKVIFVAIATYKEGWTKISETIDALNIAVEAHYCELLTEVDKIFGEQSNVFSDLVEREFAKSVALKYGKLLVKDNPLGYGNIGAAVVFERSCPNDTLPILWAEKPGTWMPLFKRL